MELSSFQLETTNELRAEVATVLNISPDHLDRYESMQEYYQAKHRIFRGAKHVVINHDDPLTAPLLPKQVDIRHYGLGKPDLKTFRSAKYRWPNLSWSRIGRVNFHRRFENPWQPQYG